ncbi:30S ribosome-binding factor RbfA [Streptomyces violaceorubidus]
MREASAGATYAGDADPYRKPGEDETETDGAVEADETDDTAE